MTKNQNSIQQHFFDGNSYKFVDKMKWTMQQSNTNQSLMRFESEFLTLQPQHERINCLYCK